MTDGVQLPRLESSALGCQLHDWTIRSRAGTSPAAVSGPRGIIFDLDDTLYPYEAFVRSGFMAVARHLERARGIGVTEAFATLVAARRSGAAGAELQVVCERYGLFGLAPSLLEAFRAHRPVLRLPRLSAEALRTLRLQGWRLVVLTNGLPAVQREKVRALGIARFVDSVVYAEEHAAGGKPAPAVFKEALRRLGVQAARAVMVGDDPARDIRGAKRMGIRTIQVSTAGRPLDARADAVIDSLGSVADEANQLLELAAVDAA